MCRMKAGNSDSSPDPVSLKSVINTQVPVYSRSIAFANDIEASTNSLAEQHWRNIHAIEDAVDASQNHGTVDYLGDVERFLRHR